MTIRLLPVNSSALATTTRIRPSENATPEEAHDSERDVGAPGGHRGREDRAERDEGAGEYGQSERVGGGHAGLDDTDLLRLASHPDGWERIEPSRG